MRPITLLNTPSSSIDNVLVINKDDLVLCGVGDLDVNYNGCPIYELFKFSKPKLYFYTRHIWSYDRGYELLRHKASDIDWNSLKDPNIHLYSQSITKQLISLAKE